MHNGIGEGEKNMCELLCNTKSPETSKSWKRFGKETGERDFQVASCVIFFFFLNYALIFQSCMQRCDGFCREVAKELWEGFLLHDQEKVLHRAMLEAELGLVPLLFMYPFPPN